MSRSQPARKASLFQSGTSVPGCSGTKDGVASSNQQPGAVRQHAEAEASAALLSCRETPLEPVEVVGARGGLDAAPRDLVPVVHIGDRPPRGLGLLAEPRVLAAEGVRHLSGLRLDGPRAERRRPGALLAALRARADRFANRGGWRGERCNGECQRERGDNCGTELHPVTTFEHCGGSTGGSPLRCVPDSREGHAPAEGFPSEPWANVGRISPLGSCPSSPFGRGRGRPAESRRPWW